MTDTPGHMIGKYQVIRNLASGSQGTVYHAYDPDLEREVALKVLHPHLATPEIIARFRREAQIVASINHPNIAGISEIGEHEGSHFIAIEYVPHTIRELIDRGPLDITRAVTIAHQAALALEAAHTSRRGITHHDIKPENLLLTSLDADGVVKLIDFGIAHAADMAPMTQAGSQWGTPFYMPPEQWMGERGDTRSDVYSLGVVMYQMLSGQVPFNSTAANSLAQQNEIARQHLEVESTSLHSVREDIPESLEAIVERCMAKLPEERYQTPGELAAALAPVLGLAAPSVSQPVSRPPVRTSVGEEAPRQNRLPLIAAGGFGAMIVIVLIVLVASRPGGNGTRPVPRPVIPPPMITTPTPTHSPVPKPTETPVPFPTNIPAAVVALEPTSTPVTAPTPYPMQPTFTPSPTATPEPTSTHVPTPTPYPKQSTYTPLPTNTPIPAPTPLPTSTPNPTSTPTATPLPTATLEPTATPIPTATPVPTATPTLTPTPIPILPDLKLGSVSVSSETPAIWEEVSFTASVSNLGTAVAGEFTIGLYDGEQVLDERRVNRLIIDEVEEVTFVWRAEAQTRTLSVNIDQENRIVESDEGNNSATIRMAPLTPPYQVDMINWDPPKPEIDERFTFWAHIENKGDRRVRYDAGVAFYLDGEFHSWSRLEKVEASSIEQVGSDSWKASKGALNVTVMVYPIGYFDYESNPSWKKPDERYAIDTEHATYNHTRLPNLTITAVTFSEKRDANTETFYLDTKVTISNEIGEDGLRPPSVKDPFDVVVEFEEGMPCPFGDLYPCAVPIEIDGLGGGSEKGRWARGIAPLPLPRSGSVHEYKVVVTVDPSNVVDESDETDNVARNRNRVTNN